MINFTNINMDNKMLNVRYIFQYLPSKLKNRIFINTSKILIKTSKKNLKGLSFKQILDL